MTENKKTKTWSLFPTTIVDISDKLDHDQFHQYQYGSLSVYLATEVGRRHPKPFHEMEFYDFPLDMPKLDTQKWEEFKQSIQSGRKRVREIELEMKQSREEMAKRIVDDMEKAGEIARFLKSLKDEREAKRARKQQRLKEIEEEFGSCDGDTE